MRFVSPKTSPAPAADRSAPDAADAGPKVGPEVGTPAPRGAREPALLIAVLVLQACAALYFLFDAFGELMRNPGQAHPLTEAPVALALGLGLLFTVKDVRRTRRRMREQEAALQAAKSAFAEVVSRQFALWALTPAERDVGLLALKGMDVAEIAQARGAAAGTVRAQLTRIYAKAGVAGRSQFAAFFVEDLLSEGLADPPG